MDKNEEVKEVSKQIKTEGIEKEKTVFYKKWWFWLIVIIVSILIATSGSEENKNWNNTINNTSSTSNKTNNTNTKIEKAKVTVIDFSQMSKEEIRNWCNTNKVNCSITEKYSDIIEKGAFVSQSAEVNSTIHEGDKITVIYSLGKEPTTEQKNALKKAESYSKTMNMSKAGIYNQLISEYGEGFTPEAAQYAIDNVVADWKANALAKAKSYQTTMNMSKKNIYKQLISEYGEKFTAEEAQYAIDHLDD